MGDNHVVGTGEARHFKFDVRIAIDECWHTADRLLQSGCVQGRVSSLI